MLRSYLAAFVLLCLPLSAAAIAIPCTVEDYTKVVGACSPVHLARNAPDFTEVCMGPVGGLLGSCHNEYQNIMSELQTTRDPAAVESAARRLATLRKKFDHMTPIYVGSKSGVRTNRNNSLEVFLWSPIAVQRHLEDARKRVAAPADSSEKTVPPPAEPGGGVTGGLLSVLPVEPDPEAVKVAAVYERVASDGGKADPKALAIAGKVYASVGAPAEAVRVLDAALTSAPDDAGILTLRADAKTALGEWKGAEADARRALELDPSNADARRIAAYLRNRAARAPKPRIDASGLAASGEAGASAPGGGRLAPAGATPRAARLRLAPPPSAGAPLILLAESKFAVGDRSAALLDASRAISLAPADARGWIMRARILNALGRHEAALKDAAESLRLSPDDPAALRESAYARFGLGDYATALAEIERALALEPGSALGHLYRAMILEKLGRTAEAAAEYRMAASLDASLSPLAEEALARLAPAPRVPAPSPAADRRLWGLAALAGALLAFGLKRLARPGWVTTPQAPSSAAPATLGPGDRLDGYRIDGVAGEGGMGIVYAATDLALGRKVAIKRMSRDGRASGEMRERFLREARLAAKLSHPNLALIHAVLEKGDPFLVFEFVDGRTLADVLGERGRLGLAEAVPILRGVGEALSHAHAHGVIHRDLKPANVMLPNAGGVKVLDFGIAHQSRTTSEPTMTGAWGTPPYMAPEQEDGVVSRATDVYALGVVCREMLTGRRPFDGPGMSAAKREGRLEPVAAFAAGLPPGLDALFQRGLAPDPSKRHATIGEFVAALERLVS